MPVAGVLGSPRYLQDRSPVLHQPPRPSTFRPLVFPHKWLRSPHAPPKQPLMEQVAPKQLEPLDAPPLPEPLLLEQAQPPPVPVARQAGQ